MLLLLFIGGRRSSLKESVERSISFSVDGYLPVLWSRAHGGNFGCMLWGFCVRKANSQINTFFPV